MHIQICQIKLTFCIITKQQAQLFKDYLFMRDLAEYHHHFFKIKFSPKTLFQPWKVQDPLFSHTNDLMLGECCNEFSSAQRTEQRGWCGDSLSGNTLHTLSPEKHYITCFILFYHHLTLIEVSSNSLRGSFVFLVSGRSSS